MLPDSMYEFSIAWFHNSYRLASGSYGRVRIWDPVTGERISTLEGHDDGLINCLLWSQSGRLASASEEDQTVKIWNPETRQCTAVLGVYDGGVISMSWSLDERWLALMINDSRRRDYVVQVWDSATGQCISSIDVELPAAQDSDQQSIDTVGEEVPDFLEFDKKTHNRLHTIAGIFDLINDNLDLTSSPRLSSAVEQQIGYGLSDDMAWITYRGENLIWLPSEYRPAFPSVFVICETQAGVCVGILCSSGRVIALTLSQDIAIQSCDSSRVIG
ncbi:hypothetical protein N7471_009067 [Penicillium samsonianum]|uniref:uncharacterized protein n=1 Tax=Penicillium samsonianum TaxID=1882272 RepID=UPI00254828CA|nr:uncharacterized protein N7471_009067 [Penicillium samsonianum]KAJ6127850.1 hypothetical protein N7471_009067 [Penicillium samsonianum]